MNRISLPDGLRPANRSRVKDTILSDGGQSYCDPGEDCANSVFFDYGQRICNQFLFGEEAALAASVRERKSSGPVESRRCFSCAL